MGTLPTLFAVAPLLLSVAVASAEPAIDWKRIDLADGPTARVAYSAAYDAAREQVVIAGGVDHGSGTPVMTDQTWVYDGTTWTLHAQADAAPSSRFGHGMAYDAARERIVLFGGTYRIFLPEAPSPDYFSDAWEWDGRGWTLLETEASPPVRSAWTVAYDVARDVVVLFGGNGGIEPTKIWGDTWEFDGEDWAEMTPERAPPARTGHQMFYDATLERVVLFGGGDGNWASPDGYFDDTWAWDGERWEQLAPPTSPHPRSNHAIAYDSRRGRAVLFGGFFRDGSVTRFYDTWAWDGSGWHELVPATTPPSSNVPLTYDVARDTVVMFGSSDSDATWEYGPVAAPPPPGLFLPAVLRGGATTVTRR